MHPLAEHLLPRLDSERSNLMYLGEAISWVFGWAYFICWSVSFYPQPRLNLRRRSTVGAVLDFAVINTLGFLLYLVNTSLLYWSPVVRAQHAARHPRSPDPNVRGNDVAFAAHAFVLSAVQASMFVGPLWGFRQRKNQSMSTPFVLLFVGCVLYVGATVALVLARGDGTPQTWAWIDVVGALGFAKVAISVVKFIPQVVLNYRRRSTVGWSIGQNLLDLAGGVLSVAQLLLDSALQGDWRGFVGNPVKFALGNQSIVFDGIFMYQHYFLYPQHAPAQEQEAEEEGRGLLAPEER